MHFTKQLFIAAIATIAPAVMHAAIITSNPTLSVGGLTFDSFSCSVSKGGFIATPSNCGQINVNTTTIPATGIQISSGFFAAGSNSFDDAVIDYHVSSKSGISSVGLDFNGYFEGYAISSVTEDVYNSGKLVGSALVSCSLAGCDKTANIALSGFYNDLSIVKDINVTGSSVGYAGSSVIDQTFTTATPEPSSMALLGSGLIGAAALLRRKNRKATQAV